MKKSIPARRSRQSKGWLIFLGAAFGFIAMALASPPPKIAFVGFDVPMGTQAEAMGINDRGQIVGQYFDDAISDWRGFLFYRGSFETVTMPPDYSWGYGITKISEQGDILGGYWNKDNNLCAFVLRDGVFETFSDPDAWDIMPMGINPRGDIVGKYVDRSGRYHAYLRADGIITIFDVPADWNAYATYALDINARGDIVGDCHLADGSYRGFLLRDGIFSMIAVPGAADTEPQGINDRGDIVGGYSLYPAGPPHGFLLRNGTYSYFDVPTARQTSVRDINNRGVIVGGYQDQSGIPHGFYTK